MQVFANRERLSQAIAVAQAVVASRTPKPILQCVKLSATKESLLLTATDLEVGIRARVDTVQVSQEGEAVAPADKLAQIVRESSDETLELEADSEKCHVRGRDSHFQMYTHDARDFPPVPELEGTPDFEVDGPVLQKLIVQTLYAAAKENTRYAINGALWQRKGKRLQLVATDGRRLAKAAGPLQKSVKEEAAVIVPAKSMSILLRLLAEPDGEMPVRVKVLPNQIVVQTSRATLTSVLAEGNFPDYEAVIPQDNDRKIELGTDEFHSAVRRASLLTSEQSKGVRLAFSKDRLVIASRAPEQGEATINVAVTYAGEPVEIGFNPTFLCDALKGMSADKFMLELKDSTRPGILRVGDDFTYVVMPVSLS